ncbi:hypothetical protein ABFG93_14270 [Pseudalkalibacillus hwajinpoensis]|uniref:hypothetical protein n=1 Tax=Guptibacillus hwajinpoensis TaxID=208199 RepID=UPI00325ACDC0
MKKQEKVVQKYGSPKVMTHQVIRFETSQSWNKGHGPVSGDDGNSNGGNYPHDPYTPKKPHKNK